MEKGLKLKSGEQRKRRRAPASNADISPPAQPAHNSRAVVRKAKREITDQDRIGFVRDVLAIPRSGEFPKISAIADKFDRDPSVVSRAIAEAFRRELVRVEVFETPEPAYDTDLQNELRERFPLETHYNLRDIKVIKTPEADHLLPPEGAEYGDAVHRHLGRALAHGIARKTFWGEAGKTVGLGGGRSVFFFVESLFDYNKIFWGDTNLYSLSGTIAARDHSGKIASNLDADFHVNLMAMRLVSHPEKARIKTIQVGRSITDEDLGELKGRWKDAGIKHAILGIGTFSPGHQLYNAVHDKKEQDTASIPESIRPLAAPLLRLHNICDAVNQRSGGFWPVGDVANTLFQIQEPDNQEYISDSEKKDIARDIQEVNSKSLTFSLEQFSGISNVIMLAGTKAKAPALLELIHRRNVQTPVINIQCLYVDEGAAKKLLELDKNYKDSKSYPT